VLVALVNTVGRVVKIMSGIGREGVKYAIEEMTETKSLVF